ncbi:MAG TPA: hypothetical protein VEJ84_14730 [Acidimicrobiales bacterium]|nr:hypothetical protein [Acidimicrobiales bacterium]
MEVQTGLLQGASPSSQYWFADMAVNEMGLNPEGTGPPAGWPPGTVAFVADVDVDVEVAVVAVLGRLLDVGGATVVDGAAALVGDPDVVAVVEAVVGAAVLLVEMALLFVPPHAAASTITDNSAAPTGTNVLHLTDLPTLGHRGGFPAGWAGAESVGLPLTVGPMRARNVPQTALPKVEVAGQRLFGGGAEA